mgnify:CR=1 FL=1
MQETTYQAARAVAHIVESHFKRQLTSAEQDGATRLAPSPHAREIERILDTAFWASLRREEGHPLKISLAYLPPEKASQPLIFSQQLPLTPATLTKLAPGVERPGIHLGVWQKEDELYLWGTTRTIPSLCFVVDVSEPGLLVIKHRRRDGFGKFANVVVLKGDQVKVLDTNSSTLPERPSSIPSLLGLHTPSSWDDSANVLVQLAVSMRAHGRGGSLLVVPAGSDSWRKSIVHPISYAVEPSFSGLGDLVRQEEQEKKQPQWQELLRREVDSIAGLTAVDGATLISNDYQVLAFGAKIGRPEGNPPVERVLFTEPVVGGSAIVAHPAKNGGTRHLSAAQFVQDQQDAMALIASQDGRFTIYAWSPYDQMVRAHQVDTLLL